MESASYGGVLPPAEHTSAVEMQWPNYVAEIEKNVALQLSRHASERFARAMELLGDDKLEVRWGGIFALERISRLSPQEQSTVSEVLATFVRRRAFWKRNEPASSIESEIQLIVTVLGRRHWPFKGEDRPLDLHGTNLAKAHLPFAHLEAAFLYDCNFESALLYQANLQGAWLARSCLRYANLDYAQLQGADLADADGLTEEQLHLAQLDDRTVLPPHLANVLRQRRQR